MLKKIIIVGIIITIVIVGYNYVYQDHRDIESETSEFIMSSDEIANQFSENSIVAEQKFLNKTIEVSGLISELDSNEITIADKVFCQFTNPLQNTLTKNSIITIKGRVIGYDDLLEQVKLDQCLILK